MLLVKTVPPVRDKYHFIAVPVADKSLTVELAQNVWVVLPVGARVLVVDKEKYLIGLTLYCSNTAQPQIPLIVLNIGAKAPT